ncbi:allantoinase AllB [Glycomyces terrestris]|uniref:allantoinase n=1 Tax=Glycomyces terrestris TaxID=2493553 RepID=A0A426UTZ7_9ACTN|nr:allantoinase AllB [Glycomyces terrestris]RRR97455.1 allantoinase AllB [Glycomyces terrestris]
MTDASDIAAPVVYDLVLRSRRTVLPDGERPAAVAIAGERIAVIGDYTEPISARRTEDLGDLALLPGLVDTHVHVNEPGRTEWEGFATATRAAAAGGVTTLIDMPLNSLPPTVDTAALAAKREAAKGKTWIDTGFWGGAIPGNETELKALHEAGVFGFKCFTAPSGVDEFPPLDRAGLIRACTTTAALGTVLIVHAENPDHLRDTDTAPGFADFLVTRPPGAETDAVQGVIDAAKATRARVHILHLSAAAAIEQIHRARRDGVAITAETCPHYLALAAEHVPDGATAYKCCPPLRDAANRDALWDGLARGRIDFVVSDHSPSPPAMKTGDFATSWGGIASLQIGLPVVWTEARARGHGLADVARWMSRGPADFAGLHRKGRIAAGADADLVAFDPDREWTVRGADLLHRHPVTPYDGRRVTGRAVATWLRGKRIGTEAAPRGRQLHRSPR